MVWVICSDCDGEEGYFDSKTQEWIDCKLCQGSGGWENWERPDTIDSSENLDAPE